jgi:chromosomal replication initiator protein
MQVVGPIHREMLNAKRAREARFSPPPAPPKIVTITNSDRPQEVPVKVVETAPSELKKPPKGFDVVPFIVRVVARHYGYSVTDLIADRRTAPLCRARHIAMFLAKEMTTRSYPYIGRMMGNRDHSSIIHGVQKMQHMVNNGDPVLVAEISALQKKLADALSEKLAERAQ